MVDTVETKPTEIVKEPEKQEAKVEPVKELSLDEIKAELDRAKQHALNKEQEAARHFEKLKKFEEAEQKAKEAQMTEIEKATKKALYLENEVKRLKTDNLKITTAQKLGLPESLALRLQGETPEEIEADAKQLLETLPKKTSTASATNPGGDRQVSETDAERRKRLGI